MVESSFESNQKLNGLAVEISHLESRLAMLHSYAHTLKQDMRLACKHSYVVVIPSGPRDNGEREYVCEKCGMHA